MDLKFTVYKTDENGALVEDRVVVANSGHVRHGVFRKLCEVVDINSLPDEMTSADLIGVVSKLMLTSIDEINSIMLGVFAGQGVTEEDLDNGDTAEMVAIIVDLLMSSFRDKFAKFFGK